MGATTASQSPIAIQVNERWSSAIKMFVHHFAHAACKLLRMLKIWKLPEGMRMGDQTQKYNLEGPNATGCKNCRAAI